MPARVAEAARAASRPVLIIGLQGHAEPAVLAPYPHVFCRLGNAGRIRAELDRHGCREIVMVGRVRRPSVLEMRPDAEMTRLLAKIGRSMFGGDDGLLAAVARVMGEEGYVVRGVQEVMAGAVGPAGLLSAAAPDTEARADIARGIAVARALGAVDVGQCCVVQQGLVLAVEAAEGTDAMLARCRELARPGLGGVMVKLVKPGQDRRADLPTIGAQTVRGAHAAGLRGIAYEGRGTLIADRAETVACADALGLFLLGLDPDTELGPEPTTGVTP